MKFQHLSPGIEIYDDSDAFWIPAAGVYRHTRVWPGEHIGLYHVIATRTETLNFFCDYKGLSPAWTHRWAVCDDFGNLVRVNPKETS